MILHFVLLPVNTVRLVQIRRMLRGVRTHCTTGPSIEALLPVMTRRTLAAGETMVRRGESADRMFYLASGEVRVVEIGKTLGAGTLLGEIGVFARDQKRTATLVCITACEVFELTQARAKEIYFQDPAFGYAVLQLVIARLIENAAASTPDDAVAHASDLNKSTQPLTERVGNLVPSCGNKTAPHRVLGAGDVRAPDLERGMGALHEY
jgi:CRP-like cAMP-binding protein